MFPAKGVDCRISDLLRSGRATYNQHDYQEWQVWFDSSAAVLQLAKSDCIRRARSSQPGILSFGSHAFNIEQEPLRLRLSRGCLILYGAEFEVLLQAIIAQSYQGTTGGKRTVTWWTEYASYALIGCHAELFSQYHRYFGRDVYAEDGDTVYHESQIGQWNASHVFREDEAIAPFIFFQSQLWVTSRHLAAKLRAHLSVKDIDVHGILWA